ncbi:uncharacterized protein A4U43_C07F32340 [Asparagus officinalis]|uniref:Uncharacterized protein n=1 Tax=Asparagus officinalis TaxID=4686 RepID=A0A5P1EGU8_ASPOF|nr:uncharacterized protein A4U43_C07F32340 [Asparagus officinalis]
MTTFKMESGSSLLLFSSNFTFLAFTLRSPAIKAVSRSLRAWVQPQHRIQVLQRISPSTSSSSVIDRPNDTLHLIRVNSPPKRDVRGCRQRERSSATPWVSTGRREGLRRAARRVAEEGAVASSGGAAGGRRSSDGRAAGGLTGWSAEVAGVGRVKPRLGRGGWESAEAARGKREEWPEGSGAAAAWDWAATRRGEAELGGRSRPGRRSAEENGGMLRPDLVEGSRGCCVGVAGFGVMELVDAGVPLPTLAPIKQTITQVEGVKCLRHAAHTLGRFHRKCLEDMEQRRAMLPLSADAAKRCAASSVIIDVIG